MLLKGQDGTVVASASVLAGDIIHGKPLREGCVKVAIEELIQVGATAWFLPFDDDDAQLYKGGIVEWPKKTMLYKDHISPLRTRSKK